MAKLALADWRSEQHRLTVFPLPDAGSRSADWWQAVTGGQPDQTTANPKRGSSLIVGSYGPGQLILRLEPERIDWILAPPERDINDVESQFPPSFGSANETVELFSVVAAEWLRRNDLPAIARIAFGAVLVHPEVDRVAGYRRLPAYLPVEVDPESSDFLYQINLRPVPSATGIQGLRLNRLSKWSVAMYKLLAVRFTGSAVAAQPAPEALALRLELDINTVPSFTGPIPQDALIAVYRELVDAGCAIATNGVRQQ